MSKTPIKEFSYNGKNVEIFAPKPNSTNYVAYVMDSSGDPEYLAFDASKTNVERRAKQYIDDLEKVLEESKR